MHAQSGALVHRYGFLKAAVGVVAVGVLSLLNPNLPGGEPDDPARGNTAIPHAQAGSLYPLLKATASRSTLELSFLQDRFKDLDAWKREARPKVLSLLQYQPPKCDPRAEVVERIDCGPYIREKLYFNTTPDIRVPAYLLLPKGEPKRRPAIVALHDHGAFFVWGKEKVIATEHEHPAHRVQADSLLRAELRRRVGQTRVRRDRYRHVLLGRTADASRRRPAGMAGTRHDEPPGRCRTEPAIVCEHVPDCHRPVRSGDHLVGRDVP